MKIPASIPKKYHKYITYCEKEAGFDDDGDRYGEMRWNVWLEKYTVDKVIPCHSIVEKTLSDVVSALKCGQECDCEECTTL